MDQAALTLWAVVLSLVQKLQVYHHDPQNPSFYVTVVFVLGKESLCIALDVMELIL